VIPQHIIPLHMGQLHAWEHVLVAVLAFGPFILLGIVVMVVRRRDIAEEDRQESEGSGPDHPKG
jgi:Na+-translocating ferredoxin:NAD+ oxidoreductase RnfE subunit